MTTLKSSLVASVLMLASATVAAQTPPPDQQPGPGGDTPPPDVAPPPAPPPVTYPSMGPNREIRIMENMWVKFGLQAQAWFDSLQDSAVVTGGTRGYVNNLFLRRARMLFGAQVMKNVAVFFQTDNPNLGKTLGNAAGKSFGTFILQDAWGEVKLHDALIIHGGLLIVPFSRQLLASTTTFWNIDIGNTTGTASAPLGQLNTRDTGFELQGFVLEDHLQYRVGVFSGLRNPPLTMPNGVGGQNSPLFATYIQYNFFDVEKTTFVYGGHNYGKKKIVGVAVGGALQKGPEHDPFWAGSINLFAAWPLSGEANKDGGDEIGGLVQFIHFNGQDTAPTLPNQNDLLVEVGYYNKELSFGAFGKFEMRRVTDEALKAAQNTFWFGGGLRYYIKENNCQFAIAYNRAQFPDADSSVKKGTNEFTFQMQVYYY